MYVCSCTRLSDIETILSSNDGVLGCRWLVDLTGKQDQLPLKTEASFEALLGTPDSTADTLQTTQHVVLWPNWHLIILELPLLQWRRKKSSGTATSYLIEKDLGFIVQVNCQEVHADKAVTGPLASSLVFQVGFEVA